MGLIALVPSNSFEFISLFHHDCRSSGYRTASIWASSSKPLRVSIVAGYLQVFTFSLGSHPSFLTVGKVGFTSYPFDRRPAPPQRTLSEQVSRQSPVVFITSCCGLPWTTRLLARGPHGITFPPHINPSILTLSQPNRSDMWPCPTPPPLWHFQKMLCRPVPSQVRQFLPVLDQIQVPCRPCLLVPASCQLSVRPRPPPNWLQQLPTCSQLQANRSP